MKKYFRIINKLITKHGNNKKVLQYVFNVNKYIINKNKQYGGEDSDDEKTDNDRHINIIENVEKISIPTLEYTIKKARFDEGQVKILEKMNTILDKIIG